MLRAEDLVHYETISAKYGYWNATSEETSGGTKGNAAIEIRAARRDAREFGRARGKLARKE